MKENDVNLNIDYILVQESLPFPEKMFAMIRDCAIIIRRGGVLKNGLQVANN